MGRSFAAVILSGAVIAQICASGAKAEQNAGTQVALASGNSLGEFSALPAIPRGKSTIVGGEVQNVDPVRDEFRLKVVGQRPMKILFDERTDRSFPRSLPYPEERAPLSAAKFRMWILCVMSFV